MLVCIVQMECMKKLIMIHLKQLKYLLLSASRSSNMMLSKSFESSPLSSLKWWNSPSIWSADSAASDNGCIFDVWTVTDKFCLTYHINKQKQKKKQIIPYQLFSNLCISVTSVLFREKLKMAKNAYPTFKTEPATNCFLLLFPLVNIYFLSKWRSQTTIFDCGNGMFSGYVDLINGIHSSALLDVTLRLLWKMIKIRNIRNINHKLDKK